VNIDTVRISVRYPFTEQIKQWNTYYTKTKPSSPMLCGKRYLEVENISHLNYYPNMNGGTLFISFNLNKLVNRFSQDITVMFNAARFDIMLRTLLQPHVDLSYVPENIMTWQTSRIDYFIEQIVPAYQVSQYLKSYSRIEAHRMYTDTSYLRKGTVYFKSGKPGCASSYLVRIYNKTKQLHDGAILMDTEIQDYDLENDFNNLKDTSAFEPENKEFTVIRYEVQLLRDAIRGALRKAYGVTYPRTLSDDKGTTETSLGQRFPFTNDTKLRELIAPDLVAWVINSYIIDRLGLNLSIRTPKETEKMVLEHFALRQTRARNVIEYIRQYNEEQRTTVTERTEANIKRDLVSIGLHYVTAKFNLEMFSLLCPDESLMKAYLMLNTLPYDEYGPGSRYITLNSADRDDSMLP
jgi:hypothetical protein